MTAVLKYSSLFTIIFAQRCINCKNNGEPYSQVGSLIFLVIFQKRLRVFHRGLANTRKQMKARGRRPSAFIVFECLETPMKHEERVFEIASQSKLKLRSRNR